MHTLTRLKSIPALRDSQDSARSRTHPRRGPRRSAVRAGAGARMADAAEGRRRGRNRPGPPGRGGDGADPPVPRRRHADPRRSGPPADVGRAAAAPAVPSAPPPSGGGGARALRAVRRWLAAAEASRSPPGRALSTFRDVVAFVGERKEAMLHAHLLHSVHLVRFAPPVIELRPQPEAPRDLAAAARGAATEATGTRWTIALSARRRVSRRSPNRATPPIPREGTPRRIIRWCARSWRRFRGRGSIRCMIRRPTPMACRRRRAVDEPDMPDVRAARC